MQGGVTQRLWSLTPSLDIYQLSIGFFACQIRIPFYGRDAMINWDDTFKIAQSLSQNTHLISHKYCCIMLHHFQTFRNHVILESSSACLTRHRTPQACTLRPPCSFCPAEASFQCSMTSLPTAEFTGAHECLANALPFIWSHFFALLSVSPRNTSFHRKSA